MPSQVANCPRLPPPPSPRPDVVLWDVVVVEAAERHVSERVMVSSLSSPCASCSFVARKWCCAASTGVHPLANTPNELTARHHQGPYAAVVWRVHSYLEQIRRNMAIADKVEARNLRWKAHDAAQLVTAMQVRKVRRERA